MNRVLYICFTQKGEDEGFVFPSELEKNEYSPGINTVISEYYYRFDEKYIFEAYDNDRIVELVLTRNRKNIFFVHTKRYGTFFFKAKLIQKKYNKYLGKYINLRKNDRIYELVSMQPHKLEQICSNYNFFFLGSVDQNIGG